MSDTQADIGETLMRLSGIHKTPKSLMKAVVDRHPKAKKKDIARAAFRVMIEQSDGEAAATFQEIGINGRTAVD